MKRKNGFTLIELLAVLVILAILALIATPLVLGYIETSRKETAKVSAKEYLKAIEQNNMTAKFDKNYTMIESGDALDINEQVKVKGDKPTSGQIIMADNNTVDIAVLCINDYLVSYNENDIKVGSNCKEGTLFGGTIVKGGSDKTYKAIVYLDPENLMNECDKDLYKKNIENYNTDKILSDGTKSPTGLATGCMKWYMYKEENDKYVMMLDHNLGSNVSWNSAKSVETDVMTEVSKRLDEATSSWDTVLRLNKTIDRFNYEGYMARIITANELADIIGASDENTIGWDSNKIYPMNGYSSDYTGSLDEFEKKYIDEIILRTPTPTNYYSFWQDSNDSQYNHSSDWLFDHLNRGCIITNEDCTNDNNYYGEVSYKALGGYWTSSASRNLGNINYGTDENPIYLPTSNPTLVWYVQGISLIHTSVNNAGIFSGIRPVIEVPKIFFE